MNLSDVNANYEDVFQLEFPRINTTKMVRDIKDHPSWTQYNVRKPHIRREGLSVTSRDGGMSGRPDLDSLLEVGGREEEFNVRTPVVDQLPEIEGLLDYFEPYVGRCHFIRMHAGGFFPPHRDNGFGVPASSFRVVVPLLDFTSTGTFIWLLDGKPLNLNSGKTYYVNTTKNHSLFSMCDTLYLFVMNIVATPASLHKLVTKAAVR